MLEIITYCLEHSCSITITRIAGTNRAQFMVMDKNRNKWPFDCEIKHLNKAEKIFEGIKYCVSQLEDNFELDKRDSKFNMIKLGDTVLLKGSSLDWKYIDKINRNKSLSQELLEKYYGKVETKALKYSLYLNPRYHRYVFQHKERYRIIPGNKFNQHLIQIP